MRIAPSHRSRLQAVGIDTSGRVQYRYLADYQASQQHKKYARIVAYRLLYKLYPIPDEVAYFHAQWRRSRTQRDYPEHVLLDSVQGSGLYVGTYLAWIALSRGWWGEGEVKFYLRLLVSARAARALPIFAGAAGAAGLSGRQRIETAPAPAA